MTSNPHFNRETTGTEAAKVLGDAIKGKNVVITGASPNSLRSSAAQSIASQAPANIILASRTASNLKALAADIAKKYPSVSVHTILLNLASLDSIQAAAAKIDELV
ncbi:unnamed protein product [Discula destructiva]